MGRSASCRPDDQSLSELHTGISSLGDSTLQITCPSPPGLPQAPLHPPSSLIQGGNHHCWAAVELYAAVGAEFMESGNRSLYNNRRYRGMEEERFINNLI